MRVNQERILHYVQKRKEIREHKGQMSGLLTAFNEIRLCRNHAVADEVLDERLKLAEKYIQLSCEWFAVKSFELGVELEDLEKRIKDFPHCLQLNNIKNGKQRKGSHADPKGTVEESH